MEYFGYFLSIFYALSYTNGFTTLKELRTQIELDLKEINAELLKVYNAESGSSSCGSTSDCQGKTRTEPKFGDLVEEQYPPLYYEKVGINKTKPFGKWPDAGTTDWSRNGRRLNEEIDENNPKIDEKKNRKKDEKKNKKNYHDDKRLKVRRLQDESTTTSTAAPVSTDETSTTSPTDSTTVVPTDTTTADISTTSGIDTDMTTTTGGTDITTTTVGTDGTVDSTTDATTPGASTTTPVDTTASSTHPNSRDKISIDWDDVAMTYVHDITPSGHVILDSSTKYKLQCSKDKVKDYLVEKLNKNSSNGKKQEDPDDVGFYRFVGIEADTMLVYPSTPMCDWESPIRESFVKRTTLGPKRIMVRIFNGFEMWAPFGLSHDITAFYDYASTDLSKQNTKMLINWIESLTEEDELCVAFFEPIESPEELILEDLRDPIKTWTLYPKPENGYFLKLTVENKKLIIAQVTGYHEKFLESFGFYSRNFLKSLQRDQTAVFIDSMNIAIDIFEKQEELSGVKCHKYIYQVDTFNDTVVRLQGGSSTGAAPAEVKEIPTDTQIRQVLHRLLTHNIVYSRIQSTYIEVHNSTPDIFRFDNQSYQAAHRTERYMEPPTSTDIDNYGDNPHEAVLLKTPTILACLTGGISMCSPYNVLWDYTPFHLSDVSELYVHQDEIVYVEHQDRLVGGAKVLLACQAVYNDDTDLIGVGCIDVKHYINNEDFALLPDYQEEMILIKQQGLICPKSKPLVKDFSSVSDFSLYIKQHAGKFNKRNTECDIFKTSFNPLTKEYKSWDDVSPGSFPETSYTSSLFFLDRLCLFIFFIFIYSRFI